MLRLRDIMTREVLAFAPETTLREAVVTLGERHVGGAPVVAGSTVVGVVSTSDIIEFQGSPPPEPAARTDGPREADEPTDERDGPEWEREGDAPGAYFTELWADSGAELGERFAIADAADGDFLAEHTVAEAMSRRVRSLGSDASVDAAAALMARAGIHRVLVIDDGTLVGIVTTMDVTRAVANHRLHTRHFVFERPHRPTPR